MMDKNVEDIEKNIEVFVEYTKEDPRMDDVKQILIKENPSLEDRIDRVEKLSKYGFLTAKIRSKDKMNLVLLPEILPREINSKKQHDCIQFELARLFRKTNFAFNFNINPSTEILTYNLAIPTGAISRQQLEDSIIDQDESELLLPDILKDHRNILIKHMPNNQVKIFKGAHPVCLAQKIYNFDTHYIIWSMSWDLGLVNEKETKPLHSIYAQNFGSLHLSNEIPVIGNEEYEAFIILGSDEEISKTVDEKRDTEKVQEKLINVEDNIKKSGFEISRIMSDVQIVSFDWAELIGMGLGYQKDGNLKTSDRIVRDASEITSEQIIRDTRLHNKHEIVESLFKSFNWRINNIEYSIYREQMFLENVPNLATEFGIKRPEMFRRRFGV